MHMILNNTHFRLPLHCLLHMNQIIINNSAYMHSFSDSSTLHSPALIDLKKSHEDYVDVFWGQTADFRGKLQHICRQGHETGK